MSYHQTTLCFTNMTSQTVTVTVDQIDSYDWDGSNRPDANFNGVSIAPNTTYRQREDVNSNARSSMVYMTASFPDGTSLSFRFDQYDACKGISPSPRAVVADSSASWTHTVVQRVDASTVTNSFTLYTDF